MNDWIYLSFALTMLAAQFSPGPDMLLLLKNAVNHPLRAGIFTVLGICCGLGIHTAVAILGLAAAFRANPTVFRVFAWTGAAYLAWLAVKLLTSLRAKPVGPEGGVEARGEKPLGDSAAFRQGFLTNMTNAKAFLFLAAFIAAALKHDNSTLRKAILAGIILGQALVFWSLFVWLLKRPLMRSAYLRAENALNLVFGVLLLLVAAQVAWGF
jgi:threonine/homoserine/homoserine lactone efflux protein